MNEGIDSAAEQDTTGVEQTQPEGGKPEEQTAAEQDTPKSESKLDLESALKELKKAREESARHRVERNELRAAAEKWKEYEDSQKSELQLAQERLAAAEEQLAQAQASNILLEVASSHGIKPEDMGLLGIGAKEELEARAARIKELYGNTGNPTPPPSQTPRQGITPGSGLSQDTPPSDQYPESWVPPALRNKK